MTDVNPEQDIVLDEAETTEKKRRISPFAYVIMGLAVLLVAVLALQLVNANQTQPHRGPAPDFTLELFEGGTFTLSENRGKVIVINFWASWCGPCRAEAPALEAVWNAYKDRGDVMIIGVDYVDNTQDALGYIEEFGVTYPNGPDLGTRISDAYHIQGVPETFVVGKDGNIHQFIYAGVSARELSNIVDSALAAN